MRRPVQSGGSPPRGATGAATAPRRPPAVTVLGAVLRASAREEGGVRALARAAGISHGALYDVFRGRAPGRHVARAIAAYLEITREQVAAWAAEADE